MLTLINDKFTLLDEKVKIIYFCKNCKERDPITCECLKCIITNGKETKLCTKIELCIHRKRKSIIKWGKC